MAISRAQLLKELLPGLNALFGLEYAKYGEEHKEIYETETSERSFEEETKLSGFSAAPVKNTKKSTKQRLLSVRSKKKQNCLASPQRRSKTKVVQFVMTTHKKLGLLDTTTKRLPKAFRSLKKRLKITCTTACPLVTPRHLLALWLTPSRLKLLLY